MGSFVRLGRHDLTQGQADILDTLGAPRAPGRQGWTILELAIHLGHTPPSLRNRLSRMESHGWVIQRACLMGSEESGHKRARGIWFLGPAGKRVARQGMNVRPEWFPESLARRRESL